ARSFGSGGSNPPYGAINSLGTSLADRRTNRRQESRLFEDTRERLKVARIAIAVPPEPVLGAPEEVGVKVGGARLGPAQTVVVVRDHLLWWTAIHRLAMRAGRRRHGFPRLRLPLRDHEATFMRGGPAEELRPSPLAS